MGSSVCLTKCARSRIPKGGRCACWDERLCVWQCDVVALWAFVQAHPIWWHRQPTAATPPVCVCWHTAKIIRYSIGCAPSSLHVRALWDFILFKIMLCHIRHKIHSLRHAANMRYATLHSSHFSWGLMGRYFRHPINAWLAVAVVVCVRRPNTFVHAHCCVTGDCLR